MLGTSSLTFVSDLWFPDFLMPSIGFPKCYVHQHSVRYVHFVFNFTTLVCATRPASALRTDVICSTHVAGNEILAEQWTVSCFIPLRIKPHKQLTFVYLFCVHSEPLRF
jgi:hypothetical protein